MNNSKGLRLIIFLLNFTNPSWEALFSAFNPAICTHSSQHTRAAMHEASGEHFWGILGAAQGISTMDMEEIGASDFTVPNVPLSTSLHCSVLCWAYARTLWSRAVLYSFTEWQTSVHVHKWVPAMCTVMGCFMCSWEAVWTWEGLCWVLRAHTAPAVQQHFAYAIFISVLLIWLLFWFLMKSHTNRPKCWQHKLQGQKANPLRAPFR